MPTEGHVQGAAAAGSAIPVPTPVPTTPTSSSIPAPVGGHMVIRPLRTYKDDLAEAIKKGNLSKTSIAVAEKNKRARNQPPTAPKPAPTTPHASTAPVAPKPVASTPPPPPTPPVAPAAPKPPVAPTPHIAPQAPTAPVVPATPKASPSVSIHTPEDAESKRKFFENLLHVKHDEHPATHTPEQQAKSEKPEPIQPPKSLAELLPKKESFHVEPAPTAPVRKPEAPVTQPAQKPVAPSIHRTEAPAPTAKPEEPSPFLPFWATPGGQAPVVERTPEPEPTPAPAQLSVPLTPRADGPTRGSAVEETSSALPVRTIAFALGGIVLVAALGFGGYALLKKSGAPQSPVAREFPAHLATVTSTATLDTTDHAGYELANAFYEEIAKISSGKAVGIVFTKTVNGASVPLTASEWFAQAGITPPGMFVRALAPSFAAGSYESHNGGNAFFVFEATNRDRALAGLLAWEKTLASDMNPYLNTQAPTGASFVDRTVGGVAVRIAGAGESALVYGMIDDRRIVITRGEGTFAGLVDSLPSLETPSK